MIAPHKLGIRALTHHARPRIVLLTPVMPAETGNGLAMRAGLTLAALARRSEVHLIVIPLAGPAGAVPPIVLRHAADVTVEELGPDPLAGSAGAARAAQLIAWPQPLLCRFATPALRARIAARIAAIAPAHLHVMRLYLAPYVEAALTEAIPATLDLDDDEPRTRRSLAQLHGRLSAALPQAVEAREAERFEALEAQILPRFARVLVASEADRTRLAARMSADRVAVFPNAVHIPPRPGPASGRTLLFVGTLGYAPNEDAALTLITEILPRLRAACGDAVALRIAGAGATARLRAAASGPGVALLGPVGDLAAEYARAGLIPLPIRAGGGTRIKLLEAMAHRRPVVAFPIAAEGIDAIDGQHLVIAAETEAFADACIALLRDPVRADALAMAGYERVRAQYDFDVVTARLP
jgi:glycosyltransferase involved in cell wall biosynthesis